MNSQLNGSSVGCLGTTHPPRMPSNLPLARPVPSTNDHIQGRVLPIGPIFGRLETPYAWDPPIFHSVHRAHAKFKRIYFLEFTGHHIDDTLTDVDDAIGEALKVMCRPEQVIGPFDIIWMGHE